MGRRGFAEYRVVTKQKRVDGVSMLSNGREGPDLDHVGYLVVNHGGLRLARVILVLNRLAPELVVHALLLFAMLITA